MTLTPGQRLTVLGLTDDGETLSIPAEVVDQAPGELRLQLATTRVAVASRGCRYICDDDGQCQGLLMVDPARALELGL